MSLVEVGFVLSLDVGALLMPASTVVITISARLLRRVERQHAALDTV